MGKMIKTSPLFSTGCTTKYRYRGKTYIVRSSFMIPDTNTVGKDIGLYRLRNRFENVIMHDPQLTDAVTTDTICSNVECLSARKEQ